MCYAAYFKNHAEHQAHRIFLDNTEHVFITTDKLPAITALLATSGRGRKIYKSSNVMYQQL